MINISNEYRFLAGAWHLAYYRPQNRPSGSLSDCILKFKDNYTHYVDRWTSLACQDIISTGLKFDFIVRALGSKELKVTRVKGLDKMGELIASRLNCVYCPEVLEKNRETPSMHSLKTKAERESGIGNSYFIAKSNLNFNHKKILIIDDVTTSQTTIKEIIRALKVEWPEGEFYLFCLGRTTYSDEDIDTIQTNYFN